MSPISTAAVSDGSCPGQRSGARFAGLQPARRLLLHSDMKSIDEICLAGVTGGTIHGHPLPQPKHFSCSKAVNGQWVRDVEDPDRSFRSLRECEGR